MRSRRAGNAVDGFRFWLESQGKARSTIKNYVGNVRRFIAWCDTHELDYLRASREDVTFYLGDMLAHLMPTTVQLRVIALHVFYDYLEQEKFVKFNVAREVTYRRAQARPTEPFTRNELRRMLEACQSFQERAIFLLLVGGGLRRNEVYGIKKEDVNFEARTISVLGKGNQYRMIAPGPLVMDALHFALQFEDRLCPFKTNEFIINMLKRLAQRAGVSGRIYPHRLRHTFATSFLDEGGSVEELMAVLGHSRIEMSLFYAKAGRHRRAIETQDQMNLAGRLLTP